MHFEYRCLKFVPRGFVDKIPQQVETLWVQLGPDPSTSASNTDALLNGLEIFKLSDNGNLAHASQRSTPMGSGCQRKKKMAPVKESPPGWRPLALHGSLPSTANAQTPVITNGSVGATRMGRMFTLAELKAATNNFDESLVIGNGGFGKVYKGDIEEGTPLAIKRANPQSSQGLKDFTFSSIE